MTAAKLHRHPVPGLAAMLRAARGRLGFSLREAARLSGIAHAHIRKLEDGDSNPSLGSFVDLCQAYRIDPADALRDLLEP